MKSKNTSLAAVITAVGILGTIVGLVADSLGIVDFFIDHFDDETAPAETSSFASDTSTQSATPSTSDELQYYEYREKEFTVSNEDNLSGWRQYKHRDENEYGQFGPWDYTPVEDNATTDVQTTTHYKWRTLTEETIAGEWSPWTTERRQNIGTNVEERVETYTTYQYYYFECPNCGFHMHGSNMTCASYAGGCGEFIPENSGFHELMLELPWVQASWLDWYGTGYNYTIIDGERYFKWKDADVTSTGKKYSYRETTTQLTPSSDWFYTAQQPDSSYDSVEILTITAYRWRPVYTTTTYYYWRWSEWKSCSENQYHQYQNEENYEVRIVSD